MARRAGVFLKESVILLGFLNGVWVAVGVNPAEQLLATLVNVIERMDPGRGVDALVALLPFLLLALMLWLIHRVWKRGRWMGMAAVALGFLSGMQIVGDPLSSLVLLGAAVLLGYAATR